MRLLLVGVLLLSAACGENAPSCTLIGCTDGLTLRLQPSAGRFAAGDYELRTTIADATTRCGFSASTGCDGGGACEVAGDCANGVFTAGEVVVSLSESPSSVQVELDRGSSVVVNEVLEPTYTETRPNGPDCDPICRQSSVVVTVP